MNYWLDTEFIESGRNMPLMIISLGMVAQDGRELYLQDATAELSLANEFVQQHVIPQLHGLDHRWDTYRECGEACPWVDISVIPKRIREFVGDDPDPHFWGYYADYDWVVFCQLFGTMMDLPKGWPMYCRDLKQWSDWLNAPKFDAPKGEHNALADARWNRDMYYYLLEIDQRTHGTCGG